MESQPPAGSQPPGQGEPSATPLKVCRHCSVASRTQANECPSCGKPYARRGWTWRWSWWLAIPIVAGAFLIGYGGRLLIDSDGSEDEPAITLEQGAEVPKGISQTDLESRLDGPPVLVAPRRRRPRLTCAYYPIEDQPESVWEFCFRRDELVSSAPISG